MADVQPSGLDSTNGGSLPALSSGGPPTAGTFVANQISVDTNGVAWLCTVSGTPGTWTFWGTGFFPGITTNDTGGTDYGAVINAYMATMIHFTDTPKLPPGAIYCTTEVIPPSGVTIVGSRWSKNSASVRTTTLTPLTAGMTRVASCTNANSGFRNIVIDGRATTDPLAATIAFGVYAASCLIDHFGAYGATVTTFDSNASATDLNINDAHIQCTGAAVQSLNVSGADWVCSLVRAESGTITFGGGGNMWSSCHFVGPNDASGATASFFDNGSQTFAACYFDSIPKTTGVSLIDRSSATRSSQYTGCYFYQNVTGCSATCTIFKETTTAGAGVTVTGAFVRGVTSTTWGYFIKGSIASTTINGVQTGLTYQTSFTDVSPPLGFFSGCMNNGALAFLGGTNLGANQSIATRDSLRATGLGVLSEPFPFATASSAPVAPSTQNVFGICVGLKRGDVVTGIMTRVAVAASGTNPTTVRVGLADSTGKILAVSADRGTAGSNDATTVFAAGPNKIPFTGGTLTVPADGLYFAVLLVNGTWGTTQPTLPLITATAATVTAAAGAAPVNFIWGAQTDLPAVNSSLTISTGGTRSYYLAPY